MTTNKNFDDYIKIRRMLRQEPDDLGDYNGDLGRFVTGMHSIDWYLVELNRTRENCTEDEIKRADEIIKQEDNSSV